MENNRVTEEVRENVVAGIVGAFLFALVGGVLWFVLYQVGYLAAISGIVGVICAIRGYSFFSKKESTKGIVIAVIMAAIVIVVAWYACLSYDILLACKDWYANGEIDYLPSFFECVKMAPDFLAEPDIATEYLKDLIIGLLLCAVGCISHIIKAVKKINAPKTPLSIPKDEDDRYDMSDKFDMSDRFPTTEEKSE